MLSHKGWMLDFKRRVQTGQYTYIVVSDDKTKYTLSYIELPVLLLYSVPAGRGKGFIGGGGYVGYTLDTKQEIVGGNGNYPVVLKESTYLDTNHHKFDNGLAFLMGYEYGFGLFFSLMVQYGLQEVYKNDRSDVWDARGYKTQHRQLRLNVGYMFNRKRKAK